MNNEAPTEKKRLNELINNIKRCEENHTPVRFRIDDINIIKTKFRVKTGGLYASVPFSNMPWKYKNPHFWSVIFPSIEGIFFMGQVVYFNEKRPSIRINADSSLFPRASFKFETGETYTAIILEKTNTSLQIDFGYGFGWKRGSLVFQITRNPDEDDVDLFPQYHPGEEFDAVYVGKSITGNDIFRYDDTRYISEEHSLAGQKIWATLERTDAESLSFRVDEKYIGELFWNEKDDVGVSHELLQKTLQALPDGQSLQCQVVDVTPNGTLQLKWLVDTAPDIEKVLLVHPDASTFNTKDPFLPEIHKKLINKIVWCEACNASYPKIFKTENQYTGTISMDATYYPGIPLSLIINALSEISNDQRILCKIKGIYPNETVNLQWLVQLDAHSQKLVFPTVFSQKIELEEKIKKLKTKHIMPQEPEAEVICSAEMEEWKGKIVEAKIRQYIDVVAVSIDGIERAVFIEYTKRIRKLLRKIPNGQSIPCLVKDVKGGVALLEWLIEKDTCIHTLPLSQDELNFVNNLIESKKSKNKRIEREIIKKELKEQYIGKTLLFEAQRDENNKLIFRIGDKYTGRIIAAKSNNSKISREIIKNILSELPNGQSLLCMIQRVVSGTTNLGLKWMIDDDPFAMEFLRKYLIKNEQETDTF